MNQNLIPSLIIACAIVATGLLFRQTVATSAGTQIDAALSSLESASQNKDADGKTRISKIIKGISSSVADGFKAGFTARPRNNSPPAINWKSVRLRSPMDG